MTDLIAKFTEALKATIRGDSGRWLDHNSWNGCTETGFYATDEVNMEELMAQIDEFSASFREEQGAAASMDPAPQRKD